jgi:pyruvate,water dikinase
MVYPFNTSPIPDLSEVGGKGFSLMRMTQVELPVPPGFVCPVAFFKPWLNRIKASPEWAAVQTAILNGDDLTTSTKALKAACGDLALSSAQEGELVEALETLPEDSFFAVRSSSPEEDLEGASFAGGYKTSLGVNRKTMLEALRASFASAFDERVFVYKRQHGFALDQPRIAVVVQQQIAADSAGVGFSLNPLNNDYDEAVIDANWGLGESVVAGMASADHFVVDKVAKKILEKQLGGKEVAVYLNEQGGIEEQSPHDSTEFCLTDKQVLAIADMLSHVENLYGKPTDIEWAYANDTLYLLQARPITAYVPLAPEMMTPNARLVVRLYGNVGSSIYRTSRSKTRW